MHIGFLSQMAYLLAIYLWSFAYTMEFATKIYVEIIFYDVENLS